MRCDGRNTPPLTFFTHIIGYSDLVYLQYVEMIRATEAAQKAATEAKNSRLQAQVAFIATVDQFHLDQRAWLSVKSVKLTAKYSRTEEGQITINVVNTGKTPAKRAGIVAVAMGDNENPKWGKVADPILRMVVAPNVTDDDFYITVPYSDPSATLHLKFVLEYWDVFDNRRTTFCGHYPSKVPPFFWNCPQGNDME